jgi:hypothetical protein
MATTGSILAARDAGIIPEMIPIADDNTKPKTTFLKVRMISRFPRDIKVVAYTIRSPENPPIRLKKVASNRN